ncbi:MAG: hypothetical protein GY953_53915 [bacterium]|nr:hypothetical protein [bacterium]
MNLSDRDKRALAILSVALVVILAVRFWPTSAAAPAVVGGAESIPAMEQRLTNVRRLAAQVPGKQRQLDQLEAELARWEGELIRTETAQQAQAEVLQILERLGSTLAPPVEFRNVQLGQVRRLGDSEFYGQVLVTVSFECAIEQLVNLVADLTRQPQAVATEEIRITTRNDENKGLNVNLTVAGLVPAALAPKRTGLRSF